MKRVRWLTLPLFGWLLACLVPSSAAGQAPHERHSLKSPLGVIVDEKGQTAYVILSGTKRLAAVDLSNGRMKETLWTLGMPFAHPSESSFHLEHWRRKGSSWDSLPRFETRLIPGVNRLNAISATPVDRWPFVVAHQRPKSGVPATQTSQGWVFTNALTVLLAVGHGAAPITIILDEPTHAFADPSDVVITSDGKRVFVACAGADTVLAIDAGKLQRYLERRLKDLCEKAKGTDGEGKDYELPDDLTASRQLILAKLATQANPRRLGLSGDGKTLVVANYLADSLTVIDAVGLKVLRQISLNGPKPDAPRRGEILFNSAKLTFHGQFSCASCHPGGHADGLSWDLERDGVGNFKKTKSLLGVRDTAPYGWHGSSPTLADRVAGTLRTLHRYEPTQEDVDNLVAYLESLPPPRPKPVKLDHVETVARGKALFQGKAACARCHQGETLQDGKTHDVGSRGLTDTQDAFDTPSLRGVGDNAPYLHDGRAATLEEVFQKYNAKRRHGAADLLRDAELADLMAYLKHL